MSQDGGIWRYLAPFKGSILALAVLLAAATAFYFEGSSTTDALPSKTEIFRFEKHDLLYVQIDQPNGTTIILQESDGNWLLKGAGPASTSMVNRIKHQLHDLDARTTVVPQNIDPTRYGLGKNAIRVQLHFRGDKKIAFLVGDPNPSGVSYYMQPVGSDVVYTVKKSAMDYYALEKDAFREPRFARFDINEVQQMRIVSSLSERSFSRTGTGGWQLQNPTMSVDKEEMRRILSKVASLKARKFITQPDQEQDYGFEDVDLRIDIQLSDQNVTLLVGRTFSEGREELAYYKLADQKTIYVSRSGVHDLKQLALETMRNRRVCRVQEENITSITAEIKKGELQGAAEVVFVAQQWLWTDKSPVSGSTPKRLASAIASLRALEFLPEKPKSEIHASIRYKLLEGEGSLYFGQAAPAQTDEEGNRFERRYVWTEDGAYIVDVHLYRILQDLIREQDRKNTAEQEKLKRQERIEK